MEVLDSLLSVVRRCCEGFPDKRTGTNSQYTMADIGFAALTAFFIQGPFFPEHPPQLETRHSRSHFLALFGLIRLPTDHHNLPMLEPVGPMTSFPLSPRRLRRSSARAGSGPSSGSAHTC